MSTNELKTRLDEYWSTKQMIAELQDVLSSIEDEVKAYMGNEEELHIEGYKVKYTRYQAKRFDSSVFKKEHQAMYEQYLKTTEARRFQIA